MKECNGKQKCKIIKLYTMADSYFVMKVCKRMCACQIFCGLGRVVGK
jgi:hypothetical protein